MKDETREKLEEAVQSNLDLAIDAETCEEGSKALKAAVDGFDRLKEDEKRESKKEKILKWIAGIGAVLIPAVTVELLQERFLDKQAIRAYKFEETGSVTTTPGRNFIGSIFKMKRPK